MRLRITTPLAVIADEDGILSLRAEDASGSFGILPHHADLLTNLVVSVLTWRRADGALMHCAARRGVLAVNGGSEILVATRQAILGDDLATLHEVVLNRFRSDIDSERKENVEATRLQLEAIRQIMLHLRPDRRLAL